jgi:anti-sigma factor RsiW
MDPAPSDRAERHLFAALPELDAVPRRGLALALAGVPRAGIASELGLSGAALSAELAAGRKAVRRTRVELGSGGRCERAERALSDRLDGVLSELDARFLDAHLARCSRCRTHEAELNAALDELRAGFAEPEPEPEAEPPAVEAAPEPPAVEAGPEPPAVEPAPPRARLRVVPSPPLLPPAPEPPTLEAPADPAPLPPAEPPAEVEPPAAEPPAAELDRPRPAAAVARHQRIRAALPVAVAVLVAVGLVAAAIALLSAFGADENVRAPWDGPDAPVVHPAPISGQ